MAEIEIKTSTLPTRCDICHQSDQFDPDNNHCARCSGTLIKMPPQDNPARSKPAQAIDNQQPANALKPKLQFSSALPLFIFFCGFFAILFTVNLTLPLFYFISIMAIFAMYLILPLQAINQKISINTEVRMPGIQNFPPNIAEHLIKNTALITGEGFQLVEYYQEINPTSKQEAYKALLINPYTRDMAVVEVINTNNVRDIAYISFFAKLSDGRYFVTNNFPFSSTYFMKLDEKFDELQLMSLSDPVLLYRLHRARTSEINILEKELPEYGQTMAFNYRIRRDVYQMLTRGGYFNEISPGLYDFTWKGLYLASWGAAWPFNYFAQRKEKSKIKELLAKSKS